MSYECFVQVLVQGMLLTESSINIILNTVTQKFNELLNSLYDYSKAILQKWGGLKRRHRVLSFLYVLLFFRVHSYFIRLQNKFDSTCGDIECMGEYEATRTLSVCNDGSPSKVANSSSNVLRRM